MIRDEEDKWERIRSQSQLLRRRLPQPRLHDPHANPFRSDMQLLDSYERIAFNRVR